MSYSLSSISSHSKASSMSPDVCVSRSLNTSKTRSECEISSGVCLVKVKPCLKLSCLSVMIPFIRQVMEILFHSGRQEIDNGYDCDKCETMLFIRLIQIN